MDFKPKLVAFDLDGTLAESKESVSATVGGLLGELLKKMFVAVLSGAGFPQFERQFLPALPETAYFGKLFLFPNNASQCYANEQGQWLLKYDRSLNTFEKGRIMQALKEALEETGFRDPPTPVWGERIEDRGAQITFSALGQHAPLGAKEKWHQTREGDRDRLREALVRRLPDFSVSEGGLTTVQVNPKGITKAYGIRRLIEMTEISVSEMLYVGDALEEGGNDAVVLETGIKTHQVFGPEETADLIKRLVA